MCSRFPLGNPALDQLPLVRAFIGFRLTFGKVEGETISGFVMSKRHALSSYLDEVAERNRMSQRSEKAGAPKVGTFWFIQEEGQAPMLLVASSEFVERGKADGGYIKCPEDPVNNWRSLKRMAGLPGRPLAFLQGTGPKDWPRGRAVFNTVTKRFEVYLDQQLQTPQFEGEILDYFKLPKAETSFASDPDYANARFVVGPRGPRKRAL
jgi:hypothetical protein